MTTPDIFAIKQKIVAILKDDTTIAYAIKNRVYQRKLDGSDEVSQWLNLSTYCETNITRMSYSNEKLAFVCDVTK